MRDLLIAGVWFTVVCVAQTGTVKSEGQLVPGATVKATQGSRILSTITDENGVFSFEGMTPGAWSVEVDMFGFDRARKDVQIGSNPTKIDFTLQLRDRRRPGERTGANTGDANGLDAAPGADLLVSPLDSSQLLPGVAADQSNASFLVNGSLSQGVQTQGGDFQPGGLRAGGFGGVGGLNNIPGVAPSIQNGTGVAPAGAAPAVQVGPGGGGGFGGGGFGGGGGGRGGGGGGGPGGRGGGRGGRGGRGNPAFIGNRRPNNNRITGSIYEQLGNSVLNARPFSVNGLVAPKAAYALNRFGVSAGGPLAVPKLFNLSKIFWFVNYQGNLSRTGIDTAYNEPTALERAGNFSQTSSIIYDPLNHQPFPDNIIPQTRISPIAQGLLSYLPLPNQNIAGVNQNYRLIDANPTNLQNLNMRLNTNATQKDTLALTANLQSSNGQTFDTFGCCDDTNGQGINGNLNWRHRFGVGTFNNITISTNRNTINGIPYFANGVNVGAQLGIQGTSPNPRDYGPPNLSFTNYSGLTDTSWSSSAVTNYGASDTFQLRRGKHNWSFGGGYTRYFNNTITDANGRGSFSFSGLSTAGYSKSGLSIAGTGYDFADFLLGLPETSSIRYGDSSTYFRSDAYNAFVTDDYRVSNNLTLNLGLRYEFFSPWSEKYGRIANLDIAPDFASVAPVTPGERGPISGVVYPNTLIQPDYHNFGPRTALAWRPQRRIVVRAGYGIYYIPNQYNQFESASGLAAQPPFALTNNITTSSADVLGLATGLVAVPAGKTVTNTYAVALNYQDSYIQTWNVGIQSDLPGRLVGEIDYLGTKGTHLDVAEAPNQAPLGSALTGEERLPIADISNFIFHDSIGNLIYHAAQLRLNRRFQKGISAQLLYTFSKAIDDVAQAQNFYDQAAERALSPTDHRQVLTAQWVLASPVDATAGFLSHPKWIAKALKDWTISGSLTAETGAPLSPTILGNFSGTSSNAPLRADATGLPVDSGSGYFNPAAFAIPAPGTFGNAGRDTITGPGEFLVNFSLARSINLHSERRRLEIRFDSTNTLNQVNPTGLITTLNSSQYGLITAAGAMRQMTAMLRLRF